MSAGLHHRVFVVAVVVVVVYQNKKNLINPICLVPTAYSYRKGDKVRKDLAN